MSRAPLVIAASSIAILSFSTPARAQVCGGPEGYPPPKFSTLIDLPYLFLKIQEYTLFPDKMYTSPWTNWYRETDMRLRRQRRAGVPFDEGASMPAAVADTAADPERDAYRRELAASRSRR